MIVALTVEMSMLWLFANHLAGELPAVEAAKDVGALTVFDVGESAAEAVRPPAAAAAAEAPPAPEVDLSAPSEIPPLEWAIVRLPPEAVADRSAPARRDPAARSGDGAAGSAASGVYDPFAGAAPMRREAAEGGASAVTGMQLDRAALRDLVSRFLRTAGQARGSAEFVVRVSPAGVVLDARLVGGSAPELVTAALRTRLVGATLFRPAAPGSPPRTLRLPPILLG